MGAVPLSLVAERAPPEAEAAADAVVADRFGGEGLISGGAIPLHRLRAGRVSGWDPSVPQIGWAIPVSADGGEVTHLAVVKTGEGFLADVMSVDLVPASDEVPIGEALAKALGIAACRPGPVRIRLLEVPGGADAFWLEDGTDAFVHTDPPRVVSGAEFVAELRETSEGPFEDLLRAAECAEEAEMAGQGG